MELKKTLDEVELNENPCTNVDGNKGGRGGGAANERAIADVEKCNDE